MARKKRFTTGEPTDVDGIIRRSDEERRRASIEADPWAAQYYRPRTSTATAEAERPIPTVGFDHNPAISARARKARREALAAKGKKAKNRGKSNPKS